MSLISPDDDSETAIALALGAASMCWDPPPTGVFDSTSASAIADELLAHLRARRLAEPETLGYAVAHPGTGNRWYLDTCVYPAKAAMVAEQDRSEHPDSHVVQVVSPRG